MMTLHWRCAATASGGPRRRTLGFTLIEVLLATALLAFGLGLAIAALRSTTHSVRLSEEEATRTEAVRVVQQFLRRQLAAARATVFSMNPDTFEITVFEGEPERMLFVAPMPGYLSRGGSYAQTLALARAGSEEALQFSAQMVVAGTLIEEAQPRPPTVLLDGIESLEFAYRGIDETGVLGSWEPQWNFKDRLPLQVRIRVRFGDEKTIWPPFVAALPLAQAQSAPAPLQLENPNADNGEPVDAEEER